MRQRLSLDRNWRFALGHAADASRDFEFARSRCLVKAGEARGAAALAFDDSAWQPVDLPHDWVLELPLKQSDEREFAEHGFRTVGPEHPEHSIGWYRRYFTIPESDLGKRISIQFDGVFRDSIVWLNGHRLGRHQSGYTPFRYDVTDLLDYGGRNTLAVRVDATSYEGWWYEGGGIYRHVWLTKTSPLHIAHEGGVFVTSDVRKGGATVTVKTRLVNDSDEPAVFTLASACDPVGATPASRRGAAASRPEGGMTLRVIATHASPLREGRQAASGSVTRHVRLKPWAEVELTQKLQVKNPRLWSPDEPNLYRLRSTITCGKSLVDEVETTFGIRTLRWDAAKGFFLNGRPLKIKGTCNHSHHAGVGIAMPDALHEFRLRKLKDMGCNAYRPAHYAAAPALLDACDRLGLMVLAENRAAGSSPEVLGQFQSMLLRDRNHPSIILWSIANEEHTIQWSVAGERIGRTMIRLAHTLDPTRKVTAAMHDRGLDEGFATVVDVHGWNYINVGSIETFHRRRPDQPIVGSEEGSTVTTRGIYADDEQAGYVSAYDRRAPKWGSTAEAWWTFFVERDWLAGAFLWTGFDYYGEPIPYKWPCTASHFGLMDLCGFPKDLYHYYRAWWSDRPHLHIMPHWNWPGREGEAIDVRVFGNCSEVELLLNGRSLGRKPMVRNSHLAWMVPYEAGTLEARGFTSGKRVLTVTRETTGDPVKLILTPDRRTIRADGEDVVQLAVSVVDAKNRPVPTAAGLVEFELKGPAVILGLGNGDPSSHESDKAPRRSLFNGLAMALIQSTARHGRITLTARAEGLREAKVVLAAQECEPRPALA